MTGSLAEEVRAIWAARLHEDVTEQTDFFDAGGSSLLAAEIIDDIEESLGVRVKLRVLFEAPRLHQFTAAVAAALSHPESEQPTATRALRTAIIGSGNIGTDLLSKVLDSDVLQCDLFVGRRADSPGLRRASERGVQTSADGLAAVLERVDELDVVFDGTSAQDATSHWAQLSTHDVTMVDLTPAKLGAFCVPALNLDDCLSARYLSMVTCGGQAAVPIAACFARATPGLSYVEIVSTSAGASVGPATRANMDEYLVATEQATREFTGVPSTKTMLVVSPADPPAIMRNTIAVRAEEDLDIPTLEREVADMEARIAAYVPGYRVVVPPLLSGGSLMVTVEVEGRGDWLPPYAGNLDIITCAAVAVAEAKARRGAEVAA